VTSDRRPTKPKLHLPSAKDIEDPEVGRFISALRETRLRMREALRDLPDELIDMVPPNGGSSIGDVLYHIALIEADWLFDDILQTQDSDWPKELFPVDHRDAEWHLSRLTGETLDQHNARLEKVREMLVSSIGSMTAEELHELRPRADYDLSAAWALHHLMQHEAEHRSQIGAIRESLLANR
jgi:uncharacterized damage-inducible protein DinB